MADLNFDASQVAPDTGFETVPAGWYNVAMDESEIKPTKDGAGAYLQCRFDILDGQYKGRKLFARLNVKNANTQTVEIAYKQLSAIAHAVGILQVAKSEQLHGIPLKVRVKIRKAEGDYDEQNDITAYKNINEVVGGSNGSAHAAAPASGFTPPPAVPPATSFAPPPAPPAPPPVQAGPQRPTDPSHIHAAGTDGEMWWVNGAWMPAPKAPPQPPAPAAPPAQPAPQFAAQQPWQQPAPATAPAAPPAAPAAPPAPAQHPAQSATPPWATPPQG